MAFPATALASSSLAASRIVTQLGERLLMLRHRPLALGYALTLSLSNVIMAVLPAHQQLAIAQGASTNITHLAADPLIVLPASAFIDLDTGWLWVPLTLILLGGLEIRLGWRRTLAVVFSAHVIASLASEGMLLVQVAWRMAPRSAVNVLDVGPSYVLLAALAGCLVVGGWRLRLAAVLSGALVIPSSLEGLTRFGVSAIGHVASLALGVLIGSVYAALARREQLADDLPPDLQPATARPAVAGQPVTA